MALKVVPECVEGGPLQALEGYLLEDRAMQVIHPFRMVVTV